MFILQSFFPDDTSSVPMEAENNGISEATLLANEEEGFALEPVAVTRRPKHLMTHHILWSF